MSLVKEQPLPADAPPLPEENQSEDVAGETDGGEGFITLGKICKVEYLFFPDDLVALTANNFTSERFGAEIDKCL